MTDFWINSTHRSGSIYTDKVVFGNKCVIYENSEGIQIASTFPNGQISFGTALNTDVLFNGATARDLLWDASAGTLTVYDGASVGFGTGNDCLLSHDGTSMALTNATGDVVIENQAAASDIYLKTGSDDYTTAIQIVNSSDTPMLSMRGDGVVEMPNQTYFGAGSGRYSLVEYFNQAPKAAASVADPDANKSFELGAGTGTAALNTAGGILLTAQDNDTAWIVPHQTAGQSAWLTTQWLFEKQLVFECAITTGADVSNIDGCAIGIKETTNPSLPVDDDKVIFLLGTALTNIYTAYSIANVDAYEDSGVAIAANTTYRFKIIIDSSRIAMFYINDVLINRSTALSTGITDVNPLITLYADNGGVAQAIIIHYVKISRVI